MIAFNDQPAARKILLVFGAISAICLPAFLAIFWTTHQVSKSGLKIGEQLAPLGDAAMEIKLTAALAELSLYALMNGDAQASSDEVRSYVDDAKFFTRAILEGGENDEGRFLPTESDEVRAKITLVRQSLDDFSDALNLLLDQAGESDGVGSEADAEFDGLYDDLVDRIGALAAEAPDDAEAQRRAGDARYRLAHGHLLVAEILGGDFGEDFGEAMGSFATAAAEVEALGMLSPAMAETAAPIGAGVARLTELAQRRYDRTVAALRRNEQATGALTASFKTFFQAADDAEEMIHDEMNAGIAKLRDNLVIAYATPLVAGPMLLGLFFFGYRRLNVSLGVRLTELSAVMRRLIEGDTGARPPEWRSADEVGHLRNCVADFQEMLIQRARLEKEIDARQQAAEDQRRLAEERSAQAEKLRQAAEAAQRQAEGDRREAETMRMERETQHAEADLARAAAEAKAETAARFAEAFGKVAQDARAGLFGARISQKFDDEQFEALAGAVNGLLDTVETGVGETRRVVGHLSSGDLSQRMTGRFHGAFEDLQSGLNDTIDRMQDIVSAIRASGESIANEAGALSDGAADLAGRAASQAASLEETKAAVDDLLAMLRDNASNVETVSGGARAATGEAERGGSIVAEAMEAMRRIDENSQQVRTIVELIESVAFQTNLLALNAAVEAARAGEAGRGFAVVAQEVQALAQRTGGAAEEIKKLVETSSRGVAEGVNLVTAAGDSLQGVVGSIRSVADATEEITERGRAQAEKIGDIATEVSDMDRTTQQNATVADDTAQSVESLRRRAGDLLEQVGFFTMSERPAPQATRAA